jgi:hypothetical protein
MSGLVQLENWEESYYLIPQTHLEGPKLALVPAIKESYRYCLCFH